MTTECHLRRIVGHRHAQIAWWPKEVAEGEHQHHQEIVWPLIRDQDGELKPQIIWSWKPTVCDRCGALYDGTELSRSAGLRSLYDTADGTLGPGDMYFETWRHWKGKCAYWDNCEGQHLHVVLPNGDHWDVDSRASNCTLPEDRQHRCWVRGGTPPKVTAGKAGNTCQAGAGSIMSGSYHGFLRDGVLDP